MSKKRIGILGGTFDPVHRLHLRMGLMAKEQFDLTEVWFMPSGNPPHKKDKTVLSGSLRLAMTELAVQDIPGFSASDFELKRSGVIYTADTLKQLSETYPDAEWYFILGGDSLAYLDKWYHPEVILEKAVILAALRGGEAKTGLERKREELLIQFPNARIEFLEMEEDTLSSTKIREALWNGNTDVCREWLPEPVFQYIDELGLYRHGSYRFVKLRKKMQEILPEKRYYHTLGVADTAACLAMRYGADREAAALAGLLHDCAKYLTGEELLSGCDSAGLPVTEAERQAPYLLHGKLGAWYAREFYGVNDEEVLSAICYHTTGRPGMTLLEQIVFVADYMEPGRKEVPGMSEVRKVVFCDLDEAARQILRRTLQYLRSTGAVIDPMTEETLAYYNRKAV